MIAHLKLMIAKYKRGEYGQSSERARRLDQMELQLEELEATATEDELAAAAAAAKAQPEHRGQELRTQEAGAGAPAGASAARACRHSGAVFMPRMRRQARQARRGRNRDARSHPAPVEGDPDRAGEVHLPVVREDHPAAGAVPSDRARPGRGRPAGDDPARQVRQSPAVEPPERGLRPRGHRSRRVDLGRLGRRLCRDAFAAGGADPRPCVGRRAYPRRRHDGAGAGQDADDDRPIMDLCPRRPPLRRPGPAGGAVLLLTRPRWRASEPSSRRLCRDSAGRCLCRLQ